MLHGPDWTQTRAAVIACLEPEEQPVALFTALVPPPEWGGQIVDVIVAPLVWAAWHVTWRRSARAASRTAGVSLAPRMVIALTPRRMVVWQASRRWRQPPQTIWLPSSPGAGMIPAFLERSGHRVRAGALGHRHDQHLI